MGMCDPAELLRAAHRLSRGIEWSEPMKHWTCVGALILAVLPARAAEKQQVLRAIERAETVLAIYPEHWGLASRKRVPGIVSLRSGRTVISSGLTTE